MSWKQGRTMLGLTVAGLVLAGCGAGSEASVSTGADPGPSIEGKWYPVQIAGYAADPWQVPSYADAYVEFGDGTWKSSDGCNTTTGSYKLSGDGAFGAQTGGVSTLRGCANVPNTAVLKKAQRVEISSGTLVFSSSGELARYSRTPTTPAPMPKQKAATDPSTADSGPTKPATPSSAEAGVLKRTDPSVPPPP